MTDDPTGAAAFQKLREKFIRESSSRLDEISRFIDLLTQMPSDRDVLDKLMRAFHRLAGIGTTLGFPEVTEAGHAAEARSQERLSEGGHATPEDCGVWRAAAAEIRAAIGRGGGEVSVPWRSNAPTITTCEVILVEDDPVAHKIGSMALQREGLTVRAAHTMEEAIALLDSKIPDALVTDILLPDGSGYEVIEHLRRLPGGDVPPAVITSGLRTFLDKVEAIRRGADAFFEKPTNFAALARAIEHLLERAKLEMPRVLVVGDEEGEAALSGSILETAGCQVRICTETAHFEADLAAFHPDLVMFDAALPGISGHDLTRFLRQKAGFTLVPVVVVTQSTDTWARIEAVRAGADDCLDVPIDPALLIATVFTRIERARYLRSLVERDGLTGLLTHGTFMRVMRQTFDERTRHPEWMPTLILIDIDHFKHVNDTYGHPVGDRVLASLAALMRKGLRRSDVTARYGGEEFGVIVQDLEIVDSVRLVDRLRQEFAALEHQSDTGETFRVTFSAGVAAITPSTPTPDDWRIAADQALYTAKREGRNRVVQAELK